MSSKGLVYFTINIYIGINIYIDKKYKSSGKVDSSTLYR